MLRKIQEKVDSHLHGNDIIMIWIQSTPFSASFRRGRDKGILKPVLSDLIYKGNFCWIVSIKIFAFSVGRLRLYSSFNACAALYSPPEVWTSCLRLLWYSVYPFLANPHIICDIKLSLVSWNFGNGGQYPQLAWSQYVFEILSIFLRHCKSILVTSGWIHLVQNGAITETIPIRLSILRESYWYHDTSKISPRVWISVSLLVDAMTLRSILVLATSCSFRSK